MTTFNGLVLDELGTVGNPTVEYANFVAETASPAGYDGAVLKNFKSDYTTIEFDLTLAGTESECINKLDTLAAALHQGQGALVMPGQAERGTHFNAVPNMKMTHSLRGFDGMTVPLSFIVPEGCAIREQTVALEPSAESVTTSIEVGGFAEPHYILTFSTTRASVAIRSAASILTYKLHPSDQSMYNDVWLYRGEDLSSRFYPSNVTVDSRAASIVATPTTEDQNSAVIGASFTQFKTLPIGEVTLTHRVLPYEYDVGIENIVFSWMERSVW